MSSCRRFAPVLTRLGLFHRGAIAITQHAGLARYCESHKKFLPGWQMSCFSTSTGMDKDPDKSERKERNIDDGRNLKDYSLYGSKKIREDCIRRLEGIVPGFNKLSPAQRCQVAIEGFRTLEVLFSEGQLIGVYYKSIATAVTAKGLLETDINDQKNNILNWLSLFVMKHKVVKESSSYGLYVLYRLLKYHKITSRNKHIYHIPVNLVRQSFQDHWKESVKSYYSGESDEKEMLAFLKLHVRIEDDIFESQDQLNEAVDIFLEVIQQHKDEKISPIIALSLYVNLSQRKLRNITVLDDLAKYMKPDVLSKMSPYDVLDLLSATVPLLHYNDELLNAVCGDVTRRLQLFMTAHETNGYMHIIKRLPNTLKSLALLRWRDEELLEEMFSYFIHWRKSEVPVRYMFRNEKWSTILHSYAYLNFQPRMLEECFNEFATWIEDFQVTDIRKEFVRTAYNDWLNTVLSLAILNKLKPKWASSVLHKDYPELLSKNNFEKELLDEQKKKLVLINAAAKSDLQDYSGSTLDPELVQEWFKVNMSKNKVRAIHSLIAVISSVVPVGKYVRFEKSTDLGYTIDVELCVDEHGDLQPLDEDTSETTQKGQKVAIILIEQRNVTFKTHSLLGVEAMKVRHIENMGYKTIQVPVEAILSKKTENEIRMDLNNLILHAVNKGPNPYTGFIEQYQLQAHGETEMNTAKEDEKI